MRKLLVLGFLLLSGCAKQTCDQYCINQGMECAGITRGQHVQLSNGMWAHTSKQFHCAKTPETAAND